MSELHFQLEKCPFCGNEAKLFGEINLAPYVSCLTCGASTKEFRVKSQDAIEDAIVGALYNWNRRRAFDGEASKILDAIIAKLQEIRNDYKP